MGGWRNLYFVQVWPFSQIENSPKIFFWNYLPDNLFYYTIRSWQKKTPTEEIQEKLPRNLGPLGRMKMLSWMVFDWSAGIFGLPSGAAKPKAGEYSVIDLCIFCAFNSAVILEFCRGWKLFPRHPGGVRFVLQAKWLGSFVAFRVGLLSGSTDFFAQSVFASRDSIA